MIKVKVFAVNPFREVTYIVSDDKTGETAIIDAGFETEVEIDRFNDYISRHNLKVTLAVNTHLHVDHILGVSYVIDKYNVPFAANSKDSYLLKGAKTSARMFGMNLLLPIVDKIDIDLDKEKVIKLGESTLEIIDTPGHTKGGVVIFERESQSLFTGDTIFKGSIGRTDLEGGDYDELMGSIIENILPLGPDITIYPGHGDHSTLAYEISHNPFISEVLRNEINYK